MHKQPKPTAGAQINQAAPSFDYPSDISPSADSMDLESSLQDRLTQLNAMLALTYGGGGDSFRGYSDRIQDDYLWACSRLSAECGELFVQLVSSRSKRHVTGRAVAASGVQR